MAQLNAIDSLVSGMNDQDTAAAVGVTRQSVNTGCNHVPEFQAERRALVGELKALGE